MNTKLLAGVTIVAALSFPVASHVQDGTAAGGLASAGPLRFLVGGARCRPCLPI
jgi:hypothetical protein